MSILRGFLALLLLLLAAPLFIGGAYLLDLVDWVKGGRRYRMRLWMRRD